MESSLTLSTIVALFAAMVVLAFIPSISVITVSARAAASGFIHGVFTTFGIITADIFFILLAIFGLTVIAETMGSLFVLIKYFGGAYLIWLGIELWRSKARTIKAEGFVESSLLSSFLAGLFITLGDQKAILFYLVFFPAFIDLSTISYFDTAIVIVIATLAIGSAKLCYAYMASRASLLISQKTYKIINTVAGSILIATGIFLIAKA